MAVRAGLHNTALLPGDQNALPVPSSHGYIDDAAPEFLSGLAEVEAGTDVTDWSASYQGAAGGMYTTIEDLFNWTAGAMGTTLLPEDLAAERLSLDTDLGGGVLYGLGIEGRTGNDLIGHGGGVLGWTAISTYHDESGATFAAIANGTSPLDPVIEAYVELSSITL